eukprot:5470512-Amphidinium_carterae.1
MHWVQAPDIPAHLATDTMRPHFSHVAVPDTTPPSQPLDDLSPTLPFPGDSTDDIHSASSASYHLRPPTTPPSPQPAPILEGAGKRSASIDPLIERPTATDDSHSDSPALDHLCPLYQHDIHTIPPESTTQLHVHCHPTGPAKFRLSQKLGYLLHMKDSATILDAREVLKRQLRCSIDKVWLSTID